MMPTRHAQVSFSIGLIGWWWSRSSIVLPASLAVGTLVDMDHVTDYAWYAVRGEHRLILPFHGYELAYVLWRTARRLAGQRAAVAIVASYVVHLVSDDLQNRTKPGAYWLVWRVINRFRLDKLSRDPAAGIQGRREDMEGLGRLASKLGRLR
jgi:hypothetical protein